MNSSKDRESREPLFINEVPLGKVSRKFSLKSLFRSKSHLTPRSVNSSSVSESPAASSSENSLSRRKSISATVGKLFGRKDKSRKPSEIPSRPLVSSYYQQDKDDSDDDGEQVFTPRRIFSVTELPNQVRNSEASSPMPRLSSCEPFQEISQYFEATSTFSAEETPLRTLTSSRCALLYLEKPYQGTLTLTTRYVRFQSSSHPTYLTFSIQYHEIVAIFPYTHLGTGAIHVATQIRLIKFCNLPQRDSTLSVMVDEWHLHCRRMLIGGPGGGGSRFGAAGKLSNKWTNLETKALTSPEQPALESALQLEKRGLPCGCKEHYERQVLSEMLSGTPLAIASIIFGGGLSQIRASLSISYFRDFIGVNVMDEDWKVYKDGFKKRAIRITIPSPDSISHPVNLDIIQSITRESADAIIVDVQCQPNEFQIGCQLRWCIYREPPDEQSQLIITGEVVRPKNCQSDPKTEGWVLESMTNNFKNIIINLKERLKPLEEHPPIIQDQGSPTKLLDSLGQLLLFHVTPFFREEIPARISTVSFRRFVFCTISLLALACLIFQWVFILPPLKVNHIYYKSHLQDNVESSRLNLANTIKTIDRIRDRLNGFLLKG